MLAGVDEEENEAWDVRDRSDCMHLDDVPVLELVVEDARCVDDMPLSEVEVCVSNRDALAETVVAGLELAFVTIIISNDLPMSG